MLKLNPLNQRRWRNFKRNKRAYWSLIIFSLLFLICLPAEFVANDKPLLAKYRGEFYTPIFNFYPETAFGGDFRTEAVYSDPEVECLLISASYTHLTLPTLLRVSFPCVPVHSYHPI